MIIITLHHSFIFSLSRSLPLSRREDFAHLKTKGCSSYDAWIVALLPPRRMPFVPFFDSDLLEQVKWRRFYKFAYKIMVFSVFREVINIK